MTLKHVEGNLYRFKPDTAVIPAVSGAARLFEQALAEQAKGNQQASLNLYREIVTIDPCHFEAWLNMGYINSHRGNIVEAISNYRRAIEIHPSYALAYYNLAHVMEKTGQKKEAIMYYQKAVELNPRYGDAYYNLALLHSGCGEVMQAIPAWEKYLKVSVGDNSSWRQTAKRELKRLRNQLIVRPKSPCSKVG